MGIGRGTRWICGAIAPLTALIVACSDDSGDGDQQPDEEAETDPADDTPETLRIQVTNDDGIEAPGLDFVVETLSTLDDVELFIISPRADWSGAADNRCDEASEERPQESDVDSSVGRVCTYDDSGELVTSEVETLSGQAGTAVHGMPADSVAWAHEHFFVGDVEPPHLTVSGSNGGQNIGHLAYISGTVGAAREAARHGVPGLAVSQGYGDGAEITDYDQLDYEAAEPFLLDWIEDHRAALLNREIDLDTVTSVNIPTCLDDEVRGLQDAERALDGPAFEPVDCDAQGDAEGLDDIEAFLVGFATLTPVEVDEPDGGDGDDDAGNTNQVDD